MFTADGLRIGFYRVFIHTAVSSLDCLHCEVILLRCIYYGVYHDVTRRASGRHQDIQQQRLLATRGYANSRTANSRTGRLGDWTSRGLVNSWTRQLTYWTTPGCHRRLRVLSFPFSRHLRDRELSSPRLVQSASWLVRELTSPRDVQSANWQSASWHIRELSSYHNMSLLYNIPITSPALRGCPTVLVISGII